MAKIYHFWMGVPYGTLTKNRIHFYLEFVYSSGNMAMYRCKNVVVPEALRQSSGKRKTAN